ncbi:MAG: hypothetical protein ACRDPA_18615 [Solirubrobacteraceae bacterium]
MVVLLGLPVDKRDTMTMYRIWSSCHGLVRRGPRRFFVVVVCMVIASAISVIASAGASPPPASASAQSHAMRRAAVARLIRASARNHVALSLEHHFAIFDRHRDRTRLAAADPMIPARFQASLATNQPSLGLDLPDAVHVSVGGSGFWVVPGSAGACLVTATSPLFAGCGELSGPDSPDAGGFALVSGMRNDGAVSPAGPFTVSGLAPNGNRTVTVITGNGQSTPTAVTDNVYMITLNALPLRLRVRDGTGRLVTVRLPQP